MGASSHRYVVDRYNNNTNLESRSHPGMGSTNDTNERSMSDDSDEITNATSERAHLSISSSAASARFTRGDGMMVKHSHSSNESGFITNAANGSNNHFNSTLNAVNSSYNKISMSPSVPIVSTARPSIWQGSGLFVQKIDNVRKDDACLMYPTSEVPSYNWPYWFTGATQRTGPQGSSSEEADHQVMVSKGSI